MFRSERFWQPEGALLNLHAQKKFLRKSGQEVEWNFPIKCQISALGLSQFLDPKPID
jgi:hypothetical protein